MGYLSNPEKTAEVKMFMDFISGRRSKSHTPPPSPLLKMLKARGILIFFSLIHPAPYLCFRKGLLFFFLSSLYPPPKKKRN
jgi:hypothetical protein